MHHKMNLNLAVIYNRPFQVGAFTVTVFFLFNVCFVGSSGSFSHSVCFFLVTFAFLSHHIYGKGLLTRFIICFNCLLMSLPVKSSFT